MAFNFSPFKKQAKDTVEWLKKEFMTIRTSRATPTILDGVSVESYGAMMPVSQVASITSEGPRTLRVVPWDMSVAKLIEKAIADSKLGLSVALDDKGVRVSFPELTTERRTSLVKLLKQKLEDGRVTLRKERDATWEEIQKAEKAGGMGEDEKFRLKAEMQKIVDETNKELDSLAERKEAEIMS